MMPASTYARGEIMKYLFTTAGMGTRPTTWHVALHDDDPGAAGTANEIADSGYGRIATTDLTRSGSVVTNSGGPVTFAAIDDGTVTITHASIWDAGSGGNCLFYGALAVPKELAIGDVLVFATNELEMDVV